MKVSLRKLGRPIVVLAMAGGVLASQFIHLPTADADAENPKYGPLPSVVVHGSGALPQLDKYELQDATTFARSSKTSLADAIVSMRGQAVFDRAVETVERQDPGNYMSAGREGATGTTAWVTLLNRPSAAVRGVLSTLPFDVRVYYDAGANAATLERVEAEALSAVGSTPNIAGVSAVKDEKTGAVTVSYVASGPAAAAAIPTMQRNARRAAAKAAGGTLPVPLHFKKLPKAPDFRF